MTIEDDNQPRDTHPNLTKATDLESERYRTTEDGASLDILLERPVAMIGGSDQTDDEALLAEAKFLSRLQHPGLPCVLDFQRTPHGARIVLQPTTGRSLASAVVARNNAESIPAIADAISCVFTFIKICEALSAAHRNGIVHGNLGPDHIHIGDCGEIGIQGWRATIQEHASSFTSHMRGNVQAHGIPPADGLHDDIQNIGMCLYFALAGEPAPRSQSGELDQINFTSKRYIPDILATIIRKAMSSTATEGYQSLDALLADLSGYLAGVAPAPEKPDVFAQVAHGLAIRKKSLLIAAILIAAITLVLVGPQWKRVQNFATWGSPMISEDFSTDGWKTAWQSRGTWEQKDGHLISKSEYDCAIILRQRLTPPVAIEYTGEFSSQVRPGDLSVWWCEGEALSIGPNENVDNTPAWFIQSAAVENAWCTIWRTPDRIRSQVNNLQLSPDVKYHFRVEIESDRLRLWIDHKLILEHHELFPIGSGNIGLYTWDPGKVFDDIKIWQKKVPELISPLAIGDEAYRAGRFDDADSAYARVAASHEGKPLGIEALYFQGLALHKAGQPARARKIWEHMPSGDLRQRAECLIIDDFIAEGDIPTAIERFTSMWAKYPAIHDILKQRWQICGQQLRRMRPIQADYIDAWIALRAATFSDDTTSRWLVAEMLNSLERWDDVIRQFPDELRAVAPAMLALGRDAEIAHAKWPMAVERITALIGMGKLEEAIKSPDINSDTKSALLCKVGRAQEAARIRTFPAALYLGPIDDALANNRFGSIANTALIATGRYEEAAGDGVPGSPESGHDPTALILLGRLDEAEALGATTIFYRMLEQIGAGNIEAAKQLRQNVHGNRNAIYHGRWFVGTTGLALVDRSLGDDKILRETIEKCAQQVNGWGGRMSLVCQAALDENKDDAVLAMPWTTEAKAWLCIAKALRAELANDSQAAFAAWESFTQLSPLDRLFDGAFPDVQLEAIVTWRLATLRQ